MAQKRRGRQEEVLTGEGNREAEEPSWGMEGGGFPGLILLPYLCLPQVFCDPISGGIHPGSHGGPVRSWGAPGDVASLSSFQRYPGFST